METYINTFFIILLAAIAFLLLWNNLSIERLKKLTKENKAHLPDDKYFELKYQYKYLVFVVLFSSIIITSLGYNSIAEIKNNLFKELSQNAITQNKRTDSLISQRIDLANKNILEAHNKMVATYKAQKEYINKTSKMLKEQMDYVHKYVKFVENLTKKMGYNNLYVVRDMEIVRPTNGRITFSFKRMGYGPFKKVPTVFIESKYGSKVSLINVTKKYIELKIDKSISDTTYVSAIIFN